MRTCKNYYEDKQKHYQAPQRLEKTGNNKRGIEEVLAGTLQPHMSQHGEIAVRYTPHSVVTSRIMKRRRKDRQRRRKVHTNTHKPLQTNYLQPRGAVFS